MKYDVIIVGAGPMGIYTAYEFMIKAPNMKVLLIDKGNDIYTRKCPLLENKIKHCPKDTLGKSGCKPACSMTSGFGGCGAFSDGKFNITSDFGGWMGEYINDDEVIDLIRYVDSIQLQYGAPKELTDPNTKEVFEIEKKAKEQGTSFNRVTRLKDELGKVKQEFDFILIDCPPSLGILTTNALAAADSVLIPVQCEYFALEGIMQLINTIMLAQRKVNPNLGIEGVLLTMFSNTNLGVEVIESIKGFFKERVYDTIIPRLVRLAEAPSHGKPILEYEPRNKGTIAYLNLAKEVIERNGTKEESIG